MTQDYKEVSLKELSELLQTTKNTRFGVGVHSAGLNLEGSSDREKIAEIILEEGIKLGHGYQSILGNVQSLGRNFDISSSGILNFILDDIEKRAGIEHNDAECKVIVAVPTILEDSKENSQSSKIALGFPDRSIHSGSKAYDVTSFIDIACKNMGVIPKEFILGYLKDNKDKIIMNQDFYAFLDDKKQKELFDRISSFMEPFSKINNMILEQGSQNKDRIVAMLEMSGFQNPEKFVNSILEENDRINNSNINDFDNNKNYNDKNTSDKNSNEKNEVETSIEDLERKLGKFYDATHKRGLIFKKFDLEFTKQNKRNYRRYLFIYKCTRFITN